jgi:hypothetical protein
MAEQFNKIRDRSTSVSLASGTLDRNRAGLSSLVAMADKTGPKAGLLFS